MGMQNGRSGSGGLAVLEGAEWRIWGPTPCLEMVAEKGISDMDMEGCAFTGGVQFCFFFVVFLGLDWIGLERSKRNDDEVEIEIEVLQRNGSRRRRRSETCYGQSVLRF
jgi:hypothetical protein